MSRQRAKGTKAETALVNYLREHGFPNAKRRALAGAADEGDVDWVDWLTVEVKNVRTPNYRQWLRETAVERSNAGSAVGIVVHKPHGVGVDDQGEWHVVMTLDQFLHLYENFIRD